MVHIGNIWKRLCLLHTSAYSALEVYVYALCKSTLTLSLTLTLNTPWYFSDDSWKLVVLFDNAFTTQWQFMLASDHLVASVGQTMLCVVAVLHYLVLSAASSVRECKWWCHGKAGQSGHSQHAELFIVNKRCVVVVQLPFTAAAARHQGGLMSASLGWMMHGATLKHVRAEVNISMARVSPSGGWLTVVADTLPVTLFHISVQDPDV